MNRVSLKPKILELLGDGQPRTIHQIKAALGYDPRRKCPGLSSDLWSLQRARKVVSAGQHWHLPTTASAVALLSPGELRAVREQLLLLADKLAGEAATRRALAGASARGGALLAEAQAFESYEASARGIERRLGKDRNGGAHGPA